jgi:hypothetical protein
MLCAGLLVCPGLRVVAPGGVRLVRVAWARIGALTVADTGHLEVRGERVGEVCVLSVSGELDFECWICRG